jgi:HK97 family phage major capsid protein
MDPIPSCAELRAQITLDRPTRQDLERVHAAMGARGMAAARIRQASKDAGRLVLLASEQRDLDAHQAAIGELATLAGELEPRLPMRPEDRKMRFGSSRFPAAAADYSKLQRLSREHSVVDWAKSRGVRGDYDPDAGWAAFCQGLVNDDWSAWRSDFGPTMELAMSTAEPGAGYLVPDLLSARIIDRLRSATPIFDAGAQTVPMGATTLAIPRITGDPTAAWHAESGTITPSDVTVDQVKFTAKTLPFIVKVSRELSEDAPQLPEAIRRAIVGAAMVELTRVALRGDGTANSPTGIRNQSGVTLFAIGANGGAITHDMLIDRYGDVTGANAQPNALIWTPRTATGVAKFKEATTNAYMPIPEPVASLAKFQTTVIPTNLTKGTGTTLTEVYIGDFRQLLVGMRMQLGIRPLLDRYADTGEYAFSAWMRADIQLEHGPAFSVITDSTT